MKFKLTSLAALLGLVCARLEARAQSLDMTPAPVRILSDPNYLPLAGQFTGTSAYSHGWIDGNSVNAAGLQTSSFQVNTNTLDQYLSVGITDDLSINAAIQYAPANYREIDYANGRTATLDSSGFSDPAFGATWRVFDQNSWPVDVDLLGSFTPDWIDSHTATTDEDGSVARGGEAGTVGAALGYDTRSFGIRGAFSADFLGDSSTYNFANGDTVETEGHTNYTLSLDTQTRLTELFSVNAGLTRTFASNVNAMNLTTGAPRFSEPGDTTALQLALNYNFIPNQFVLSATYAHDFYDEGRSFYDDPATDTATRDKSGDIVGVKLSYATP